jgi:uncharacterized lipoprotein YmbA
MNRAGASVFLATVLVAALGGCGSPVPRTHYYVLEPQDVSRTGAASEGWDIGVETFRVDPPYDQDKIVYRVGEDSVEVGFYPYHRWAAPLARMLPHVAAAAFDGVPGARSIEAADSRRDYDAHLSGRVLVLEEVDSPDGQRVRVRLALRLYADDGEIWSDTVAGEASLSSNDVGDVVQQMRSALDDALRDARSGLQAALATRAP